MAALLGEEASEKLGGEVTIDTMRPMQAFDAGGRARAMATIVEAMSRAKEAGLAPGDLGAALRLVDWRSEEHTSELQSLMRNSYAVFCLKKNKNIVQTSIIRVSMT